MYEEIHEYEDLKGQNGVRRGANYENTEIEDKIYVSLRPSVMNTIRAHMRTHENKEAENQTIVSLPEQVYEDVHSGQERRPVSLDGVKTYINLIETEIQKYRNDYQASPDIVIIKCFIKSMRFKNCEIELYIHCQ